MSEKDFLQAITTFFKHNEFIIHKKHFYKLLYNNIYAVYGLHKSKYGNYYYIEYGYSFRDIASSILYPRFYQLDLNCGRIMTKMGKALCYNKMDEGIINEILDILKEKIDIMVQQTQLGARSIANYYIKSNNVEWYILGNDVLVYLGLSIEQCKYHYVKKKKP